MVISPRDVDPTSIATDLASKLGQLRSRSRYTLRHRYSKSTTQVRPEKSPTECTGFLMSPCIKRLNETVTYGLPFVLTVTIPLRCSTLHSKGKYTHCRKHRRPPAGRPIRHAIAWESHRLRSVRYETLANDQNSFRYPPRILIMG